MSKSFANFLSLLFHPVFVPLYLMLILIFSNTYFALVLDGRVKLFLFLFTFTTATILPLLSAYLFKRIGLISSLSMPHKRERIIPFWVSASFFLIAYFSLRDIHFLPRIYPALFRLTAALIILTSLITMHWKISIHAITIGSATGVLLSLLFAGYAYFFIPFVLSILLGGLVASARLTLQAHSPAQVYAGFITGFIFMFLSFQ